MHHSLSILSGLSMVLMTTACVPERVVVREPMPYSPPPQAAFPAPPPPTPETVVSVYIEPSIGQPAAIACPWAPPPMLVEAPPPRPYEGTYWTGGYWVWQGTWVWAHGRWAAPPRPNYGWRQPYYENRGGVVIFIGGHWADPGVVFVPPPATMRFTLELASPGVIPGPRPMGPSGIFIPPPPGSRMGIIIPAPLGTAPAVVTGAPPVVNVGMHITNNINSATVSNTTNIINNHTTVINNITNVTIVAPATATASGRAVNTTVPAQAPIAAAMPSVIKAPAPIPASEKPIPAFVHGQRPAALPQPQAVHPVAAATQAQAPAALPRAATPTPPSPVHPAPPLAVPAPQAKPVQAPPSQVHAAPPPPPPAPAARPAAKPAPVGARPRKHEQKPKGTNPPGSQQPLPAKVAVKPAPTQTGTMEKKQPAQDDKAKAKEDKKIPGA
jgi:hypothetical protein